MPNKYNLLFLIKLSCGTAYEFTRTSLQYNLEDAILEATKLELFFQSDDIDFKLHSILSEDGNILWRKQPLKSYRVNFTCNRAGHSYKLTSEIEAESVESAVVAANTMLNNLTDVASVNLYNLTSIEEKKTREVVWKTYWEDLQEIMAKPV